MPCCEISDCAQMSKTIIAVRHFIFGLGGRKSLETAVNQACCNLSFANLLKLKQIAKGLWKTIFENQLVTSLSTAFFHHAVASHATGSWYCESLLTTSQLQFCQQTCCKLIVKSCCCIVNLQQVRASCFF